MKKYRLKKELLTVRAGALFKVDDEHLVADSDDVALHMIRIKDINNFDEWFEEVKEFEEWGPIMGDSFKTLSSDGDIYCLIWNGGSDHKHCLSVGNCYPIDTSDEVIIKEQKLIPQAMHCLKMAAKKAWFEFNGSEWPDWKDFEQDKSAIIYDRSSSKFKVIEVLAVQDLGQVYFPTEESCQAYIDNNQDDLKLLFGVE